jgi:hypothetical protein
MNPEDLADFYGGENLLLLLNAISNTDGSGWYVHVKLQLSPALGALETGMIGSV